ncbi:alpha/beta hydrolase [Persicitalea jodogahamensis]|uniref:Alpha/beta hydrolase n=1 Tax=Persicitalea jodogahamensis TaxID=402147 RepID=A0A8J3D3P7_9BACT|nr:alpha/beta hydrolase [Persicitalea jodogahamensis]GHB66959.1 alpha/beta hydrolase [Persicitalea jodogahamensis]
MKKFFLWTGGLVGLLAVGYLVGPDVPDANLDPALPAVTQNLTELEAEITRSETAVPNLKKDNEARIVWADTAKQKTPYSIVYIHGFGASQAEGDPVHRELAKRYGANLYLARLHDAGINDPDAFDDLTPENFLAGAKRALAIGEAIGDSVIVMGTSAGGLLTVYLAATHPEIKGIVLYSPCMAVANPAMKLATRPWGQQILNTAVGKHRVNDDTSERSNYWLKSYHSNGLMTLQQTIDAVARPEVYEKVTVPAFVGYYYKNEEEQDQVVSVAAIKDMFPQLGTPDALKVERAFPNSGDHVIASHFTSNDVAGVQKATEDFFEKILKMKPGEVGR